MTRCQVGLARSALGDLQNIQDWYAEQGVPEVGNRLVVDILDRMDALADHPLLGRVVPEFDLPFLRELIVPPFRVVYRHDPGRVRIVRVWRSERPLRLPDGEEGG